MKIRKRFIMIFFIIVALLFTGYFGARGIKLLFADRSWIADFGYQKDEIHSLSFQLPGNRSCPDIPVLINEKEFKVGFDTGSGSRFSLTTALEGKIDYDLLGRTEELNRDGSHRGWSNHVSIKSLNVFGEVFEGVKTNIADWKLYASTKFNGIVGLKYFQSRVITLDYWGQQIAVSNRPIDETKLDPEKYIILPLHRSTSEGQEMLPFFQVEYDDKPVMAYLDTGKNYSFVYNPSCDISMSDLPSGFTDVPIKIGSREIIMKDVAQVNDLVQAEGLPYPTMIELNSDQIWRHGLVVTLDLIDQRIIFRMK
ncbi:MAG: hypothetical protein KBA53_04450 [Thermoclostridium sp.]|nr:hypothetical protein [Thermoclostridium sp.]